MLPDQPIEYVLSAERGDPAARRWVLIPQPYGAVLRRSARFEQQRALVQQDRAALEALAYSQAEERFADCVQATIESDGTRLTDRAALNRMRERLDLDSFSELLRAAESETVLKAGAKNWPGSSSNGTATSTMQEPPAEVMS